jgi:hypothetical protein
LYDIASGWRSLWKLRPVSNRQLFITKWSSVPGEFDLILKTAADFVEAHLTTQQAQEVKDRRVNGG